MTYGSRLKRWRPAITKTEGRLEFNFKSALSVQQPEVQAQPFKCADFLSSEVDSLWMIEVTDALKASAAELASSIRALLAQLQDGRLTKDTLMKLYGTHAYCAASKVSPGKRVYFCLIVGLSADTAAARTTVRNEMQRITNKIGPSFHETSNRPIILVESIESWNNKNQAMVEIKANY